MYQSDQPFITDMHVILLQLAESMLQDGWDFLSHWVMHVLLGLKVTSVDFC